MSEKIFIGIDTSNYTTSCAFCNQNGEVIENFKILLPVKLGENGLRQSDAVFFHIKNLNSIAEKIKEKSQKYEVEAIGYSAYPRDCEGSYMPCFLVGQALGQMLSAILGVNAYPFSHQAGHIKSAVYSSGSEENEDFIAFHVSGGTTEIIYVKKDRNGYNISLLGGSEDLHAGQAIDRIGVSMGLKFPCGKEIESLAIQNKQKIPHCKICVSNYKCNLSGLENLASKLYKETNDKCLTSAFVLEFIGKTIIKLSENLRKEFPNLKIIYAGGVMSNSIIKNKIKKAFDNVYFAKPEFSTDNGAGISLLAFEKHTERG
ncbi:MAG: peptidase M22 [Clostridia bacterium]|nr:peptidase M22 [Clostridia bacterium]